MKWNPHNYQLTALSFLLANKNSGLFLDPGLGKTSISLHAIKILKGSIRGVLLIAPLTVVYDTWPGEISKWDNLNLTYAILHGKDKSKLLWENHDIYLINPEGLPWLFSELSENLDKRNAPFDTLWIDESTKFKNPKSSNKSKKTGRRTPTRFGYLKLMLPLFSRAHIMTGTPSPNSLLDLWAQIYILDRGESLGKTYNSFNKKYFTSNAYTPYEFELKPGSEDAIHNAIAHLVLDMSADKYLSLPRLLTNDIYVHLSKKEMSQYLQMQKKLFLELDDTSVSASTSAISTMKCQQIANGCIYEDLDDPDDKLQLKNRNVIHIHDKKQQALRELIDELNGKPVIIAYKFQHDLDAIKKVCGDIPNIGKGLKSSEINEICKKWNSGEIKILAGHPVPMAYGLNLQKGGNHICWYSLPWSLADYIQFNKRLHRQGVEGSVTIHRLIAKNTIDEAIVNKLLNKRDKQDTLRDALRKYRDSLCKNFNDQRL